MKNIKFFSIKKAFSDYTETGQLISLGNSFELPVLLRKLGWRLLVSAIPSVRKSTNRLQQLFGFGKYVLIMVKHKGALTTIKYLKASQLAIQKSIARDKIQSLREIEPNLSLPRLTKSGLPRFIPLSDRRAIRNGSPSVIRWWLTLFSIYRVLDAPGKINLKTITDPFTGDYSKLGIVSYELEALACSLKKMFPVSLKPGDVLFLETSSPSFRVSWSGLIHDYLSLGMNGLDSSLNIILAKTKSKKLLDLIQIINKACLSYPKFSQLYSQTGLENPFFKWKLDDLDGTKYGEAWGVSPIGQLQTKKEAAGKIRVFAMVDVWTQSALKPLHDALFSILQRLPNDGTFDQHASVKRCIVKSKASKLSFGYDLSAATDRLPISLQVSILSQIFGPDFAMAWHDLLVKRDYLLIQREDNLDFCTKLRYSVGQPMGALSSWAMLAITHHLLVQLAARRAGKIRPGQWYDNYELLGDDINIFDGQVATQYLLVMEEIGVPINRSKSVVATNATFEFAKVTGHLGHNVSAISWKMFMSQNTMMGRINIVNSLLNKDIIPSNLIGWVQNIVSKSFVNKGNLTFSYVALLTMMAKQGKITYEHLISALVADLDLKYAKKVSYKRLFDSFKSQFSYFEGLISSAWKGKEFRHMKSVISRYEISFFKREAISVFKTWCKTSNVMGTSSDLAFNIVQGLMVVPKIALVDRARARSISLISKFYGDSLVRKYSKELSYQGPLLADTFSFFQSIFEEEMEHEENKFLKYRDLYPHEVDMRQCMEMLSEMDRHSEKLLLLQRAYAKISDPKANRQKKDSPLKAIKGFFNLSKLKPNFYQWKAAGFIN